MKFVSLALLVLAIASAENWAVLVCGSETYSNYRHHADVAHAYQIMKKGGIAEDHIITMMYNDIPFDQWNPFPGELYNRPGDDSPEVYKGVVVDYEKKEVSPENLVKVLTGDESAGGKVLKSTKDDNVFLFFSDHGGEDILALPGGYLYSKDLLGAIQTMHEKQMYKKFLLYIEACYSGSMFLNLPEDLNVVAVTAANDHESSWGWYCGNEAVVKGKEIHVCLGDEFSISWMERVDSIDRKENLEDQFNYLVKQVTKSHVSRYGDVSFKNDPIGDFVGYPTGNSKAVESQYSFNQWDSRDNQLLFRRHMADSTTGKEQKKWQAAVKEELAHRSDVDHYFASLTSNPRFYQYSEGVKNFACYKKAIDQFTAKFGMSDYALKYFSVFANMCNEDSHAF